MKLSDLVVREAIITDLQAADKDGLIREMIRALVDARRLPESLQEDVIAQLLSREMLGSTGLGQGIAVPHIKYYPGVDRPVVTIARSRRGVEFDALDGEPVDLVFLAICPPSTPPLSVLEPICRFLKDGPSMQRLSQARTREQIIGLLEEVDREDRERTS